MQMDKLLSTQRITLRSCRKSDLPILTSMWFDVENGKYLSDPTEEYVDDRYRAALEEIETRQGGYYLTVVLNDTEQIIGSCFIFPDGKRERFEIAYCIHKTHWRNGYAAEILSLVTSWAQDNGFIEITAEAAKENVASDSLLRKNGFAVTGESRFKKYNMDIFYDSYTYSKILR